MAGDDSTVSPASYVQRSLRLLGTALVATPVSCGFPRNCGHSSAALRTPASKKTTSSRGAYPATCFALLSIVWRRASPSTVERERRTQVFTTTSERNRRYNPPEVRVKKWSGGEIFCKAH